MPPLTGTVLAGPLTLIFSDKEASGEALKTPFTGVGFAAYSERSKDKGSGGCRRTCSPRRYCGMFIMSLCNNLLFI